MQTGSSGAGLLFSLKGEKKKLSCVQEMGGGKDGGKHKGKMIEVIFTAVPIRSREGSTAIINRGTSIASD